MTPDELRLTDLVAREHALLVGVGHPLCGDDAIGSVLAAMLADRFPHRVIDAGPVPESFLGPLLAHPGRPVIFLDAVDFHAAPGSWCLVPAADLAARAPDTHRASLALVADLLAAHDTPVWVLGIQPLHLTVGSPPSGVVTATADALTTLLTAALTEPVPHA